MASAFEHIGRRDAVGAFALRFVGLAATFGLTYLISTEFGREALGRFGFGLAVLQIGTVFAKLGYDQAVMKLVAESVEDQHWLRTRLLNRSAIRSIALASLVVSGALLITSGPVVDRFFSQSVSLGVYRTAALGVGALALVTMFSASARSLGSLLLFSFGRFAIVPLSGLGAVALIAIFRPEWEPFHAYVVAVIGSMLVLSIAVRRRLMALPASSARAEQHDESAGVATALRSIALPLAVASAGLVALQQIDILFLGAFHTDAEVGDFNAALRLAALVSLPLVLLNAIAAPRMAVAHTKGDMESLARTTQALSLAVLLLSTPVLIGLVVYREPILGLFGDEFRQAAPVLLILSLAHAVSIACGPAGTLLSMTDRQKSFQTMVLVALVVGVVSHFLLTRRWGAVGAATVQLITISIWNIGAMLRTRQVFGFWPVASGRAFGSLRSMLTTGTP